MATIEIRSRCSRRPSKRRLLDVALFDGKSKGGVNEERKTDFKRKARPEGKQPLDGYETLSKGGNFQ